jgi:hypothetical protein
MMENQPPSYTEFEPPSLYRRITNTSQDTITELQRLGDEPAKKPKKSNNNRKKKGKGKIQDGTADATEDAADGPLQVLAEKNDSYYNTLEKKESEGTVEATVSKRKRSSTLMDTITQPVKDLVMGFGMARKTE